MSRGALRALLCTDDTDCSPMSCQHIHSEGGDKEVLPGARGQEMGKKDGRKEGGGEREGQIMHRGEDAGKS